MAQDGASTDTTANAPRGFSLRRQLLLWLLLPQLLLWVGAGALAYRIALSYATSGIDQSLSQSVRSLARQVKPVGSGLLIDFPRAAQAIIEEDPADRVSYMVSSPPGQFILGNVGVNPLPPAPSGLAVKDGEPLLYDARVDGRALRIAALELGYGEASAPQRMRVQVAKSLAVRERIARELVLDMLAPLFLLGVVVSLLVYAGIARGLRPLGRLEAQLGARDAEALEPIALHAAPREVHRLAGALNQLLASVRRRVSQEKRFIGDAAHQLRTPLAGVKSQLDLALAETDPLALRQRLTKVNAAVERSNHLVHQLLALARSEAPVTMETLDAVAVARELAREWAPRLLHQGLDFGFEATEGAALPLRGNALLLREALVNLLDNAARYAGSGATVTLRVRGEDAQVLLEVEDNGPGLAEAEREAMFERFARASQAPGGVGLGLAIVREIAQRHGGQARALAGGEGLGLKVQLVLPRAR